MADSSDCLTLATPETKVKSTVPKYVHSPILKEHHIRLLIQNHPYATKTLAGWHKGTENG